MTTPDSTIPYTADQLTAAGGRLWEKHGFRRVYFHAAEAYGLRTTRYGTGNIRSATLDGDSISNCEARRILAQLGEAKVWYDLADNRWHWRIAEGRRMVDDVAAAIIEAITARIPAPDGHPAPAAQE